TTVPSSSIIPVNIQVSFDREFIRRDRMDRQVVHANRIRASSSSDTTRERQRLQAAQDLGAVVEEDAVDQFRLQSAPVQLAARLDHQRKISLPPEPFHHALQI